MLGGCDAAIVGGHVVVVPEPQPANAEHRKRIREGIVERHDVGNRWIVTKEVRVIGHHPQRTGTRGGQTVEDRRAEEIVAGRSAEIDERPRPPGLCDLGERVWHRPDRAGAGAQVRQSRSHCGVAPREPRFRNIVGIRRVRPVRESENGSSGSVMPRLRARPPRRRWR